MTTPLYNHKGVASIFTPNIFNGIFNKDGGIRMHISNKTSIAIHCLIFINEYGEEQKVTSELFALSTGCNPVTIRNIISCLNKNGIIEVVVAKKLYQANKGIHVTNSYYSMSAMQFAAQNNIELVDGEMIEEYISEISQKNNK